MNRTLDSALETPLTCPIIGIHLSDDRTPSLGQGHLGEEFSSLQRFRRVPGI
jgi:hypothetical protein